MRIRTTVALLVLAAAIAACRSRSTAGPHARGEALFTMKCKGCHGVDRRVIGPPLQEIATLYREDPEAIVRWARAPGRRRPEYPRMPAFASTEEEELRAIAEYMLAAGSEVPR